MLGVLIWKDQGRCGSWGIVFLVSFRLPRNYYPQLSGLLKFGRCIYKVNTSPSQPNNTLVTERKLTGAWTPRAIAKQETRHCMAKTAASIKVGVLSR